MANVAPPELFLASQSPRRRELLTRAGVRFEVCEPGAEYVGDANEHETEQGAPIELAAARAARKALGAKPPLDGVPVLAVDTVVDLDGRELGKARDRAAAERMLRALAGKVHRVHTAHCLMLRGRTVAEVCAAEVTCRVPSPDELRRYVDSEQWRGKAGAYGIQDPAQSFLALSQGAFDTVVGLHVDAVRRLLAGIGAVP